MYYYVNGKKVRHVETKDEPVAPSTAPTKKSPLSHIVWSRLVRDHYAAPQIPENS